MKRASSNQGDESTRQLLEKTTKTCKTGQTFSALSQRFRASLPRAILSPTVKRIRRNVDKKAVLLVVDIETGFNSATVLFYQTVEAI